MKHRIIFIALSLSVISCSDDSEPAQDAAPEAAPDIGVADLPVADLSSPDTQAPSPIGDPCTKSGNECGTGYECLLVDATSGYCTMTCGPDDPATLLIDEDSCPGSDQTCATYTPQGGTSADYCFQRLANTPDKLKSCNLVETGSVVNELTVPDDPRMAAARLTPTSSFVALAVRYEMSDTVNTACDATLAHRCDVWASAAATPEATPTVAETFAVPASSTNKTRALVHQLATPLTVSSGERLYVAVELATDKQAKKALCLHSCDGLSAQESFLSDYTTQPPHVWKTFKDTGSLYVDDDVAIYGLGFYAP